jgi:hypothetical protein
MPEDNNPQLTNSSGDNSQATPLQPLARTGGQKVIQHSPELVQEIQQVQQQVQPVQPMVVSSEPIQPSQLTPQQSVYPQPSPPANGQMQVGMSASQMGFRTQHGGFRSWKSFLKPFIATVLALVVLGSGFLFFKGMNGYGTKTVQGDGFSYSVTFSKLSSTTTVNGKPYLQGKDKSGQAMLLFVGDSVQAKYDCRSIVGGTISIVSRPTIDGSQHNLCYSQSLNAYDMNFMHNNTWYFLTVFPKDKSVTLDQDTVKMIANSVSVQ